MQLHGPNFPVLCVGPELNSPRRGIEDSVDIRLARIEALLEPGVERACREILTPEELAHADAFARDGDRRRALLGRALLRRMLSLHAPVAPAEWRFRAGPHGKPEIAAPSGHELRFNLSHAGDFVACAVSRSGEIGIDLEDTSRAVEPLEIGERVFAGDENRSLRNLHGRARQRRFFEFWTLKEAWLKARGSGFALDPRGVSFDLDEPGRIRARFQVGASDDPANWCFALLEPEAGTVLALAARKPVPLSRGPFHG